MFEPITERVDAENLKFWRQRAAELQAREDDGFNASRGILYAVVAGALAWLVGIFIGMVWFSSAHAAEPFSNQDLKLEGAYTVAHLADWSTTLDIANHPGMRELNPILGSHPSRGEINAYMGSTLMAHWAITYLIPAQYRVYWLRTSFLLEGYVVHRNVGLGLSASF